MLNNFEPADITGTGTSEMKASDPITPSNTLDHSPATVPRNQSNVHSVRLRSTTVSTMEVLSVLS